MHPILLQTHLVRRVVICRKEAEGTWSDGLASAGTSATIEGPVRTAPGSSGPAVDPVRCEASEEEIIRFLGERRNY